MSELNRSHYPVDQSLERVRGGTQTRCNVHRGHADWDRALPDNSCHRIVARHLRHYREGRVAAGVRDCRQQVSFYGFCQIGRVRSECGQRLSQPLSAIRIRVGRSEALDFSFRQCDRNPDHVVERSSRIESSFVTRAAEGVRDRDGCVDARSGARLEFHDPTRETASGIRLDIHRQKPGDCS